MKHLMVPLISAFLLFTGCTVGPKPIDYGHVGCHYCSMTIVDQQHAAQLVTQKGKVFNFDAIECMLNQLKDGEQSKMALFLVNDFERPGKLMDATSAAYLISENIPSPMGAYLSAFSSEEASLKTMEKEGGKMYTWTEIKTKFQL